MEEVTKPNVINKPKPKWKSKFKKRNEAKEAKEVKVLEFAKMGKEMLREELHSNDLKSIHTFVAREGSPQKRNKRKVKRKAPRQSKKTLRPKKRKSLQCNGRKTKGNMW
jgi:hypothetical protein